jgi:hypothetical protein
VVKLERCLRNSRLGAVIRREEGSALSTIPSDALESGLVEEDYSKGRRPEVLEQNRVSLVRFRRSSW